MKLFVCGGVRRRIPSPPSQRDGSQLMAISSLRAHDSQLSRNVVDISIAAAVLHVMFSCCVLTASGRQQKR